jgi:hypothetical protein
LQKNLAFSTQKFHSQLFDFSATYKFGQKKFCYLCDREKNSVDNTMHPGSPAPFCTAQKAGGAIPYVLRG